MGTYIKVKQPDLQKLEETNEFLHQYKTSDGYLCVHLWNQEDEDYEKERNGTVGYFTFGEGDFKISGGSYVEEDYIPCKLFEGLAEAREKFGIIIDIPTSADDYLEESEIGLLTDIDEWKEKCKSEEKHYELYKEAQQKALKEKREELQTGVMKAKTWGIKDVWLLFGNVEKPQYLQYHWEVEGEKYSDIYRNDKGESFLLIPLMEISHNGASKVYESLIYAWDNLGLRTDPYVIMISVYKFAPESIQIDGKVYKVDRKTIASKYVESLQYLTMTDEVVKNKVYVKDDTKLVLKARNGHIKYIVKNNDTLSKIVENNINYINENKVKLVSI